VISPLGSWFPSDRDVRRFRTRQLGREAVVLRARGRAWREVVPGFDEVVGLVGRGLPFQTVAEQRYERSGDRRRLKRALASGATVYVPQAHQVLPRLARLMVALRVAVVRSAREECSFLFLVEGRGRAGMGLHHDGRVHGFWLQAEGRRTVTVGPPVTRRTPADLDDVVPSGPGWRTLDLTPGTLFYLPPYTPHAVVCHARSLAVSMTWSARATRQAAVALVGWDVAAGQASPRPRPSRARMWTQVPVLAARPLRDGSCTVHTPDGMLRLSASAYAVARHLTVMPALSAAEVQRHRRRLPSLIAAGLLAPEDLPRAVIPDEPRALDGWRFR
jgi:hypothetical protein